jgi:hypothetical protein
MAQHRIDQALRHLRDELTRVNYLIRLLESMAEGKPRRGRPPKFLAGLHRNGVPKPGKRLSPRKKAR